jgi:hypothetical protein
MQDHVGLWWVPSNPTETVAGALALRSGGGAQLDLVGGITQGSDASLREVLRPGALSALSARGLVVHGQAPSGKRFTLYDGFIRRSHFGSGAVSTAALYFNRGFEGAWIDDPAALLVKRIYMRYPGMDAWLAARTFNVKDQYKGKRVVISHTMPKAERFRIDAQRQLILAWSRNGPRRSVVQTRVTMHALPWLGIEYASAVPQDRALDDALIVGEMLSLFLGAPTEPRQIDMRSPQFRSSLGNEEHLPKLRPFCRHLRLPESFRKWIPSDVLIPLSLVRPQFESLLQRWFALRHQCWGVIVPYMLNQRCPAPFAERRVFDFAAAAESLHAHLCRHEKKFSDPVERRIRKDVLRCVPEDRRDAYSTALKRVNELTYRERLERLLRKFPALMQDVIGDSDEQVAFCKLVKDLRNAEAHGLKRTAKTDVGGLTLVRIASKLRVILDAWLLAEMGIAETAIENAMRKNRAYWFYASAATWSWKNAAVQHPREP